MGSNIKAKLSIIWRSWIFSIIVVLLVATSFRSAIADWNIVPTGSMKPTIIEGDRIFVNKLAYDLKVPYTTWHIKKWSDPKRGDIVVFFSPENDKRLVKRVIGLPNDIIVMRNNKLYINGKPLSYKPMETAYSDNIVPGGDKYRYLFSEDLLGKKHPVQFLVNNPSLNTFGPIIVPEDCFFMLGDNRDQSADSRFFGFVARDRIVGEATAIVASFDKEHYYHPRWDRFFTGLP